MVRAILIASVAVFLAASADAQLVRNYRPVRQTIDFPAPGTVRQVANGKEMIRHGNVTVSRGIRLPAAAQIGAFTLSAGFYPQLGEDQSHTYHSYRAVRTDDEFGFIGPVRGEFGRWATAPDALRVARDGSELCLLFVDEGRKSCRKDVPLRAVSKYRLSEKDLQQKLIYDGGGDGAVRLIYWENSGHYARPELAAQIVFHGPFPKVIEYKGARLRVLSADSDSIRFELLENFPTLWTAEAKRIDS